MISPMTHRATILSGRHPRPHARQQTAAQADADRLYAAVGKVLEDYEQVAALLPEPQGKPKLGTIGRHAPESSEPWQGEAASVYWSIHFGARRLEDAVRTDIGLSPHEPVRGGSDGNTVDALRAIRNAATTMTAGMLHTCVRRVEGWHTAIMRMTDIDQADTWVPVPRQPGHLPPTCPYCTNFTLRMSTGREIVRCFNPPCRDGDGKRPVARMERGRLTGDGMLVFGDQTVVHYREEAQTV